jgi:aspartyl/asparaginyl beta-hydroxylase (cupin superfamily)
MQQVQGSDTLVRERIRAARLAAESGRIAEAQQLFKQAQSQAPRHPLVLNEIAMQLIRAGKPDEADKLLAEAVRAEPSNMELKYNHAVALRALSRADEAMQLLEHVLGTEPGNMAALFEKASIEQQRGQSHAAAATYWIALQKLPPNFKPPQWMEAPLRQAREAVEANSRALEARIEENLASLRSQHASVSLDRFDRCLDIMLQKRKIFRQQPSFMYYPDIPDIEFYDRKDFPWLDDLEAAADDIRAELVSVLEERGESALTPYVADQPQLDAKYFGELNQSRRWGVYQLWNEGVEFPEHIARCPRTVAALQSWPKWDVPGSGPTALFSILAPKTRIPAHTGPVNTRLVVHLALIVPENCGFRVGAQVREWHPGKAFVFNDSISHEAWNDSNEPRAVLIVDTWSPFINKAEQEFIRALTMQMEQWYGHAMNQDLKSS